MATATPNLDLRGAVGRLPGLFVAKAKEPPHVTWGKRLLALLAVFALLGVVAGLTAFAKGHHALGTSSEMPWGLLIATYVFFVVSSTGLCLVSSLGHVFGFEVFQPLAKRAIFLALVTLLVGFAVIGTELERPLLLTKMVVISPNPTSPIWWMGTLYGVYMVLIAAELVLLVRHDHRRARWAGIASIVAAVSAHSNLGAVFGLSHARPYWYGPFLPIYFIGSALVCGAALLILLVYLGDWFQNEKQLRPEHEPVLRALAKLLALFLGIVLFFTVWKIIVGIFGDHTGKAEVTWAMLTGPHFFSFWFFETFLGFVVPLALLLGPRRARPGTIAAAAALPMIAVFVMRFNFVVGGQMFSLKPVVGHLGERIHYGPPFKGSPTGFLSYTPSLVEVGIVAGALAGATLLYVVGSRLLEPQEEG